MSKAYFYSKFTRLWHWLQAALILMLLLSGFLLHSPQQGVGFAFLVQAHNTLAILLLVNAGLGFFYYLTTGELRQFNLFKRGFVSEILAQMRYYSQGIFHEAKHPFSKSPAHRMNLLQRATYAAVLGLLLPIQAVTGLIQWNSETWPEVGAFFGGTLVLSAVHVTVAWLFGAFIIIHIYMATTGHSWSSNFTAMITGWELVAEKQAKTKGGVNER